MNRVFGRITLAVALAVGMVGVASATVIVYDFTGTADVSVDGGFIIVHNAPLSGTVTLDVNPANQPATAPLNQALTLSGWVTPTIQITTGSGIWQPVHVANETEFDTETVVRNNYAGSTQDMLLTQFHSESTQTTGCGGNYVQVSSATLKRYTSQPWLTGFDFATGAGLAPGPGAFNHLVFQDTIYNPCSTPIPGNLSWHSTGDFADISLTSFVARTGPPTSDVPEPGTLGLLSLGLAGLRLARRHQA